MPSNHVDPEVKNLLREREKLLNQLLECEEKILHIKQEIIAAFSALPKNISRPTCW